MYAVKVRKASDVKKSKLGQDYFEIIGTMNGDEAFIKKEDWDKVRTAAGKPLVLE